MRGAGAPGRRGRCRSPHRKNLSGAESGRVEHVGEHVDHALSLSLFLYLFLSFEAPNTC